MPDSNYSIPAKTQLAAPEESLGRNLTLEELFISLFTGPTWDLNKEELITLNQKRWKHVLTYGQKHYEKLKDQILVFENNREETKLNNLFSWLDYFEAHHPLVADIYPNLVLALMTKYSHDSLLPYQTTSERKHSQSVLEHFITKFPYLIIENNTLAIWRLLKIAAHYGSFDNLSLVSYKDLVSGIDGHLGSSGLLTLFKSAFCRYETPRPMLERFQDYNTQEFELFWHIQAGKNVRHFAGLPAKISRKESFFFITCDSYWDKQKLLIPTLYIWAKLSMVAKNNKRILDFLIYEITFRHDTLDALQRIDFWRKALRFIIELEKHQNQFDLHEIMEYLNYIYLDEAKEGLELPNSLSAIINDIILYHNLEVNFITTTYCEELSWTDQAKPDVVITLHNKEYIAVMQLTGEALRDLSLRQNHCAEDYARDCYLGKTEIWQIMDSDGGESCDITIEVNHSRIVQARGLNNRMPTQLESFVLIHFSIAMKYPLDLIK